jgi:group I intron endonuclease
MNSGIYSITNIIDGKSYIGSAKNIKERLKTHKSKLKLGNHINPHLQYAWNKYGEDSFKFEIMEEAPINELLKAEQVYLDIVKLLPFWYYNLAYNATAPMLGLKLSDEAKIKIGNAHRGKSLSIETRNKMALSRIGKKLGPHSEEHKRKIGLAHLGVKRKSFSIDTRNNMAKAHLGKKRKPFTEQALKNMSLAQLNRSKKIKEFNNV